MWFQYRSRAFRSLVVLVVILWMTSPVFSSSSTRPPLDTIADIEKIVAACRGTAEKLEKVGDVAGCLAYLDRRQDEYLTSGSGGMVVPHERYHFMTLNVTNDITEPVNDGCESEIFDYHAYWTGEFTWRVELFVKGYLFTQNIKCSRLTLWIDETRNPNATVQVLNSEQFHRKFESLRRRGLMRVKGWMLPDRVFMPSGLNYSEGYGFVDNLERRGKYPDSPVIGDAIQQTPSGEVFLRLDIWGAQEGHSATSMSDVFRFYILHVHGGVYLDVDMLLLQDIRPLLMAKRDFAERWGALSGPGDFNTGVMALQANSSLSSFFMRAGVRQGLYFHPRAMGHYLWREGRVSELLMLESAAFDPVWPSFAGMLVEECPSPCFEDFRQFFLAASGPSYGVDGDGDVDLGNDGEAKFDVQLKHFFPGAFTYHIHNQWTVMPEPGSWLDVIMSAHDDFFQGSKPNMYGEWWQESSDTHMPYGRLH